MTNALPLREAVRGLVIDPDHRVLLVRFEFSDGTVWAMPGGGIEEGEAPLEALHRELIEEVGLHSPMVGGLIWEMTRSIANMEPHGWSGQRDAVYLVRSVAFEPQPSLSWDQLRSEALHELRWWSAEEVAAASDTRFAPRRLPALLHSLIADGAPTETVVFSE